MSWTKYEELVRCWFSEMSRFLIIVVTAAIAGTAIQGKAFADDTAEVGNDPAADGPGSRDALFGDGEEGADKNKASEDRSAVSGWRGFSQFEFARTIDAPVHWSKLLGRVEATKQGRFSDEVKWKIGARVEYDAVYNLYNNYPPEVAKDQRFNLSLRENYIDVGTGNWDFRFGRQHVVWGEMVGLFFADVVSALDRREFILPEFDIQRIPQWAARAEYFKDDVHAEVLWIPVPSYDEIGKPGAEFFPAAPPPPSGFSTEYRNEVRPSRTLANTNYGARISLLRGGWDISGFYYRSMDAAPTFHREIVTSPQTFIYEGRHDRIEQAGGTLAKDFGAFVLKGEAVYTDGRHFNVTRLSDTDGVVRQNTLDWAAGVDFTLPADTRVNLQLFQRTFFDHDPDTIFDKHESGYSILVNGKLTGRLQAEALWIASINRTDWLFRPKLVWDFDKDWKATFGVDVFSGAALGMFGRFGNRDRVYAEFRHSY